MRILSFLRQLKEDLASQEVEDEGHEEEEEPQEETQTVQPHPPPDLHMCVARPHVSGGCVCA